MVTVFQINSGIVGSTGNIMRTIDMFVREQSMNGYIASVANKSSKKDYPSNHIEIGTIIEKHIHRKLAAITGREGGFSYLATRRLLKKVDAIKPDIIHLHNLHWDYINFALLFGYLKSHPEIRVVWTLHDCWSFTGHCPYYDLTGCSKWQTECRECPVYRKYPVSYVDNSERMHRKKKEWFLGLPNVTLVTPSQWLRGEVAKSFLRDYPTEVIKNGINTEIFSPCSSDFRSRYGLEDKFVIMGSAYSWSARKGYDAFIELSKHLDDRFAMVMIGGFMPEQRAQCEECGIICLPRTSSKQELAQLYSASDVFFNPTREEVFGLVNIEAQACQTPVITFNTGGSPECIAPGMGYVVEKDDIAAAARCVEELYQNRNDIDREKLREWTLGFNEKDKYREYIALYRRLLSEKEDRT